MENHNSIEDNVLIAIRQMIRAVDLRSKNLVQKCGLTGPQLSVLKELAKHDEILVGNLAKILNLSNATVTGILDRLQHKQMLLKERSQQDRRKTFVRLTDLGRDILSGAPSLLEEQFVHKFRKLQVWEQNLILSTLQRVATMMNVKEIDYLAAEVIKEF
ncbi:MarR family winged helix-turn-helix transcriptional regulator [Candidatus Uabimicrobium sp. HlEnr_7]|uniref:MarR family winged helix-turn-helix transcriptional regulator n=1 Tax=Candidatus Uabimicrobium helgolandensis TaxID=3095367 RepID=UPI0035571A64